MIYWLRAARRQEHRVSSSSILASSSERNRPIFASVSVFWLMDVHGSAQTHSAIDGVRRLERPARLTTGLILFAFAASHLLNHARSILLAPWQTDRGLLVLYTSFLVHGLLGLYGLHRRRHLRLPASEAWQLGLGLTIPLLLIMHAGGIRIGTSFYGREFGYGRVLYAYWVAEPEF